MNHDIFCHSDQSINKVPGHKSQRHAPPVTTTLLLQTQASMIQMISKLKTQKKGVTPVIHVPIRWGLLFGLLVVDGVADILGLDQETRFCCSHQLSNGDPLQVKEKQNTNISTPSSPQRRTAHNGPKKNRTTPRSSTPSSASSSRSSSRSSSISNKHWPSVRRVTAQRDLTNASGPTQRLCRQVSLTASEKSATRSLRQ